jgi:type IV pilus assembly protein PilC
MEWQFLLMTNHSTQRERHPGGLKGPANLRPDEKPVLAVPERSSPPAHKVQRWINAFGRIIGRRDLTIFTRQLATLIKAGMPIVRALEVLSRQEKNTGFKAVIEGMADAIRSGGNLSDGLSRHPRIFDRLYVNMVKAGEAAGMLAVVLERLALFMEKTERIKGRVKSAMTYPVIIMVVALSIVSALMVFVVPRFQGIFNGLLKGQPLPALTRHVLTVCNLIRNHALIVSALFIGLGVAGALFRRTQLGRRIIDRLLIRMPLIGVLFLKSAVARFTRTFGTLLASGVPMLKALAITRDTAGNVHVAAAITVVHNRVKEGDSVARPLAATGIFPDMVAGMIEVGEETGALPAMLARVADAYDEEVDNAVAGLTSIIEPVMIVIMAVMVGLIVIALFLPIIRIIQLMS